VEDASASQNSWPRLISALLSIAEGFAGDQYDFVDVRADSTLTAESAFSVMEEVTKGRSMKSS